MCVSIASKVNDLDNVATIFANDVRAGSLAEVRDKRGGSTPLALLDDIPYGHKVAVTDIHAGEQITKYGEEIGQATREIRAGEYVHVHNLDSMRARGDLEPGGKTK